MTTTSESKTATLTENSPPADRVITAAAATDTDEKQLSAKRDASWPSVLFYIHLNILGLYGIMVLFTNAYLTTVIFTAFLSLIGVIGVTCGAHRLWAHHTYQANAYLKFFLMICQTMAGQVSRILAILSLTRHLDIVRQPECRNMTGGEGGGNISQKGKLPNVDIVFRVATSICFGVDLPIACLCLCA